MIVYSCCHLSPFFIFTGFFMSRIFSISGKYLLWVTFRGGAKLLPSVSMSYRQREGTWELQGGDAVPREARHADVPGTASSGTSSTAAAPVHQSQTSPHSCATHRSYGVHLLRARTRRLRLLAQRQKTEMQWVPLRLSLAYLVIMSLQGQFWGEP